MKAKRMFEELGYIRQEVPALYIEYINSKDKVRISFSYLGNKPSILIREESNLKLGKATAIFPNELKAINKQVEELGWFDEGVNND